jgi:hypothetical protein
MVIDWWMTEKFEAQMSQQMNGYIQSLSDTILYGAATSPLTETQVTPGPQGGIVDALPVVCDRLKDAYRQRFYQQIVTRGTLP